MEPSELAPGVRVRVGAVEGEVVYAQHIGCCGGMSVAVRVDATGQIIYAKPVELRFADDPAGDAVSVEEA